MTLGLSRHTAKVSNPSQVTSTKRYVPHGFVAYTLLSPIRAGTLSGHGKTSPDDETRRFNRTVWAIGTKRVGRIVRWENTSTCTGKAACRERDLNERRAVTKRQTRSRCPRPQFAR